MHLISFRIITRWAAAREGAGDTRPSSTCSSCPRLSLVVGVARVWWWYHVHDKYRIPLSPGTPRVVWARLQRRRRVRRRPRSVRLAATWRRSGNRTGRRIHECRHVSGSGRQEARTRGHPPQRTAAPRGTSPRVRRSQRLQRRALARPSCGIDAFLWLATSFAIINIFRWPGQADHSARNACTTRLWSHTQVHRPTLWTITIYCSFWDNLAVFCLPCGAIMVLLGTHRSRVASISPRTLVILSKSPSQEGVAVLMKVAFYMGAAGFVSPLTLAVFLRVSIFHLDRSFDGGRGGLAAERRGLSACSSSTEGTFACLQASGEASGRSGRSTFPSESLSTTLHAHHYSHEQGFRALRITLLTAVEVVFSAEEQWCEAWFAAVPGPGGCGGRHRQRRAGADSTLYEPALREELYEKVGEADLTSKVWMSCAPPRDPARAEHLALAPQGGEPGAARPEWQHPLFHPGADPSRTGIRLRHANFQDEDLQEKNPEHVLGARGRCGDMRRLIQRQTGRLWWASWCWDFEKHSPQGSVCFWWNWVLARFAATLERASHVRFARGSAWRIRQVVWTGMCSTIIARSVTSHAAVPGNCARSCPCISAICTAADARVTISDVLRFSSGPLWVIWRASTGWMSTKSSGSCCPDLVRVSQARRSALEHSPFVVSGTCSMTRSSRMFCFDTSCNREVESRHFWTVSSAMFSFVVACWARCFPRTPRRYGR